MKAMAGLSASILIMFTACVGPQQQLSRQESLALRKNYDESRTKVYVGRAQEQVLNAVNRLFTLDDVDYLMSNAESDCMAYRDWMLYFVFGFTAGKDYWYISTKAVENGTQIMIREITSFAAFSATPTGGGGAQVTSIPSMSNPDLIEISEMKTRSELYRLFFQRLDYLLEYGEATWVTCNEAQQKLFENEISVNLLDPLCLVATDAEP